MVQWFLTCCSFVLCFRLKIRKLNLSPLLWRNFSDSFPNFFCLEGFFELGIVDALNLGCFLNLEKIFISKLMGKKFSTSFDSAVVRHIQGLNSVDRVVSLREIVFSVSFLKYDWFNRLSLSISQQDCLFLLLILGNVLLRKMHLVLLQQ